MSDTFLPYESRDEFEKRVDRLLIDAGIVPPASKDAVGVDCSVDDVRPVIVRSPTGLRYVHFDVDRVDPYTVSEGLSWEKIFEADVRAVDPPSYLDFQAAWELEAGTAPSINTDPYSVDLGTINWMVRYEFGIGIFSSNRHAIISGCAPYAMDFDYELPPAFPLPSMIKASGRW